MTSIVETKPIVYIGLDIDGVLNIEPSPFDFTIKLKKEFIHLKEDPDDHFMHSRCLTCYHGEANLFDQNALNVLHDLIKKVDVFATVKILITSTWRLNKTVDQLKEIFKKHAFSTYIVDKTVDDKEVKDWQDYCSKQHLPYDAHFFVKCCMENIYTNDVEGRTAYLSDSLECRASQIKRYLFENPGYAAFVILDDIDNHLSENFDEKFICTDHSKESKKSIFTKEDADKAYGIILQQLRVCLQDSIE